MRTLNLIIVLLLLDLVGGGLLWYGYSTMHDKKAKESELLSQIAEEDQKSAELAKLEKTLASATKEREALEQYLFDPSDENQIAFVSQMEHLGSGTTGAQVTTNSLDLVSGKTPGIHGEFDTEGSWKQLYRVLLLAETLPTRATISQWSMVRQDLTSDDWKGSFSLDITSLRSKN